MKHAREDYSHIQDPTGKIPAEEPVFLIRAQDVTAPLVVKYWAEQAERHGASEGIVKSAREQAMRMVDWQRINKVKIPDMP